MAAVENINHLLCSVLFLNATKLRQRNIIYINLEYFFEIKTDLHQKLKERKNKEELVGWVNMHLLLYEMRYDKLFLAVERSAFYL